MSAMHQQRLDDYSTVSEPSVHYVGVLRSRASRYESYGLQYSYSTIRVDAIPDTVHQAVRKHVDRRRTGHVLDIVFDSETDEILHVESDTDAVYGLPARFLGSGPAVPE